MNGVVEEPEVDAPSLRFSLVATNVQAPGGERIEVLAQCWSDGSFTCATRPLTGSIRSWGAPADMEKR